MESAKATAARYGVAHAFDDPRQLAEHPDVDVVSVCVRVPAHRELVMLALEAGKHVYCEWPLGRDTDEAAELERFARRSEEHTSELQSLMRTSHDVFCLKKIILWNRKKAHKCALQDLITDTSSKLTQKHKNIT